MTHLLIPFLSLLLLLSSFLNPVEALVPSTRTVCGNGFQEFIDTNRDGIWQSGPGRETGEECDDGNRNNGDGCSCACALEPAPPDHCGNYVCEVGEMDPVLRSDGTCCMPRCRQDCCLVPEGCGDGPPLHDIRCGDCVVESLETCDDGNTVSGDTCSSSCRREAPICGNGYHEQGEECDDGNIMNGDRCNAECRGESPPEEDTPSCPSISGSCPDWLCDRDSDDDEPCPSCWTRILPNQARFYPGLSETLIGGQDIVLDSGGNIYVIGTVNGEVDQPIEATTDSDGDGRLDCRGAEGSGSSSSSSSTPLPPVPTVRTDILLVKYNCHGDYQWHRQVNGWTGWPAGGFDYGFGVMVDPFDNVYITGGVQQAATTPPTVGYRHIIIRKYDAAGNELATRYVEGEREDLGRALAVGNRGRLFVTGESQFLVPGGSGVISNIALWFREFSSVLRPVEGGVSIRGGVGRSGRVVSGEGVVVSPSGEIFLVAADGGADLDAETVVMKFRPEGERDRAFGEEGVVRIRERDRGFWGKDIALDAEGNVYVVGRISIGRGAKRLWIEKLDSRGRQVVRLTDTASQNSVGEEIAIGPDGSIVAVGWDTISILETTTRGGTTKATTKQSPKGGTGKAAPPGHGVVLERGPAVSTRYEQRCLILKYDAQGGLVSADRDIPGCRMLHGITIGDDGSIYVAGTTPEGKILIQKNLTLVNDNYTCDANGRVVRTDRCTGAVVSTQDCAANESCAEGRCVLCGDGIVNGREQCDGISVGSNRCSTFGYNTGQLLCRSDCAGFDTSGCYLTGVSDPYSPPLTTDPYYTPGCGNGFLDPGEECERMRPSGATTWRDRTTPLTCSSLGCLDGTVSCGSNCTANSSCRAIVSDPYGSCP